MTAVADQRRNHWNDVYTRRGAQELTWYQPHSANSLRLIRQRGVGKNAAIIDVGGGASTLVGDLLHEGYTDLTVIDVSPTALVASRERLGEAASRVKWIEADITQVELPESTFDLWHDRALFHFLTDPKDQRAYVAAMMRAVKHGGSVVLAAFAESGPRQCSDLPVVRYRPGTLQTELGDDFVLVEDLTEDHCTPGGATQPFVYCLFQKQIHLLNVVNDARPVRRCRLVHGGRLLDENANCGCGGCSRYCPASC
jgi:SAM-dependent methyltransferase